MKSNTFIKLALTVLASLALFAGCDGAFVGPPQGSSVSGRGFEPLIGATPFTFEPEISNITGFAVDHWHLDPGRDTDGASAPFPIADALDSLGDALFGEFLSGNLNTDTPRYLEINFQYPMTVSFVCQWYAREADNSRPKIIDAFGREVYSDAALDISIITGDIREQRDPAGNLIGIEGVFTRNPPVRDLGPGTNLPLKGWSVPPAVDPALGFPSPVQDYIARQLSALGVVRYSAITSGLGVIFLGGGGIGAGGQAATGVTGPFLGIALTDDRENPRVENMGAIPAQTTTGQQIAVGKPTGAFGDNFALGFRTAPVKQAPRAAPGTQNGNGPHINDPEVEEALIEYSRHFAAIHANLVGQAVGLRLSPGGSIMDSTLVTWQNRYQYRFTGQEITDLALLNLPGRFRQ